MDNRKKKIAIVSVCSIILVAMVVAIAVGTNIGKKDDDDVPNISASQKAIQNICQSTEYQEACVESLKSSENSTSDTKELIEVAFKAAIDYINAAAKNSTILQAAEKDSRARSALESCRLLADRAVNDLQRTLTKFQDFDVVNFDNFLLDIKIWLSGAITYQETCLDGFEDVSGNAGAKMREALTTAMQMTSNGLAMVTEISTILESMGLESSSSRRLLSEHASLMGHGDKYPDWVDSNGRKLLSASADQIRPNLVVVKDGSGKYKTINEALIDIPKKSNKTFVLYIKEGVYVENVKFNSSMINLMIIGDGPTKTRITGRLNFIDGTRTYHTATVGVDADNFIAKDIGFENSAGPEKHQAVALRVSGDKVIFFNCHMDGYQDTLYAHTYRQFYRDCTISGTIDFIFGDSAAVFQGCTLLVRKPMDNQKCIVTAQGRKDVHQPTGLILQNCTFKADPEYYPVRYKLKSYLGRPWKEYSRTVVMESFLDDMIDVEGWLAWNETFAFDTLFYSEFNNRGPAAAKHGRVKWPGVKELPSDRVQRFTVASFLDGGRWIEATKVPYASGFIFPEPKEDPNIKYSPVVPAETKDLGKDNEKSSYKSSPQVSTSASAPAAAPPTSRPPSTTTFTAPATAPVAPITTTIGAPASSATTPSAAANTPTASPAPTIYASPAPTPAAPSPTPGAPSPTPAAPSPTPAAPALTPVAPSPTPAPSPGEPSLFLESYMVDSSERYS